jgi:hypothetical protein
MVASASGSAPQRGATNELRKSLAQAHEEAIPGGGTCSALASGHPAFRVERVPVAVESYDDSSGFLGPRLPTTDEFAVPAALGGNVEHDHCLVWTTSVRTVVP